MKKFSLMVLSFFGVGVLFVACNDSVSRVSYLEFRISDGMQVPTEESSIAKLRLTPNYEKRTLEAGYIQDFVNNEKKEDLVVNGSFGGENFDRFEEAVDLVRQYDPKKAVQVSGVPNFDVELINSDGINKSIQAVDSGVVVDPMVEELRSFYLDVFTLLTEDEQV